MKMPWKGLLAMGVLLTSALIAIGTVGLGGAPTWQKVTFAPVALWAAYYGSLGALKFEFTNRLPA